MVNDIDSVCTINHEYVQNGGHLGLHGDLRIHKALGCWALKTLGLSCPLIQ